MKSRPRLALALAAALAVSAIALSPVLAANSRTVFFGSPGTASIMPSPDSLGVLTTTDVTAGGATATDVILQNLSRSQLTHVVIQGGDAAPDPLANPGYPAPSPICPAGATSSTQCLQSLPSGTSYLAVYASPSSTVPVDCSASTSTSLSCTVGNLAPNDVAEVRVILQPPAAAGTNVQFWLASSLDEGTSTTGSNQDTFFAYGSFNVLSPTCAEVADFFPQNQQPSLSNTAGGPCAQAASVGTNTTFPQGAFELVGNTNLNYCAPGITSCFGETTQANVNFGVQPGGSYVTWDIVWSGTDLPSAKPKGVTHFLDGYDPTNPKPGSYVNIYFTKKYECSSSLVTNCWVPPTTSTKTSFEAIFRTPSNGWANGF